MTITDLDPFDDAELDEWHAVYEASQHFGREATATTWELDETRASLQENARRRFRHGLCGRVDGRIVAVGYLEGNLLDNLDICEIQVNVLPDERRQGHGSAMVARCEAVGPRARPQHRARHRGLALRRRPAG